jgi:1-phosphofructokinase family hexose kinase
MLIAGPNLTIDRTLSIEEMRPGEVLRFRSAEITPGGKGVNVARVARCLKAQATVIGFVPGQTGRAVAHLLAEDGIDLCEVRVGGEVRSTAVIIEDSGRVTVFNEPGPAITSSDWAAYEMAVEGHLSGDRTLICTGSTPPGAPADAYARLVSIGRRAGCLTLVDATGPLLRAALSERPAVITPNIAEAASALGRQWPDGPGVPGEAVEAYAIELGSALVSLGARSAVVTAGAAGLALVDERRARWLPAPGVHARNPVGAGDSFVGGMVVALKEGRDMDEAVRLGAATAAASVEHPLAGGIETRRVRELAATLAWSEAG